MAKKKSEILENEIEILRTKARAIGQQPEASEEDIERGRTFVAEIKEKELAREQALRNEAELAEILRVAQEEPTRREDIIGTPQFMRRGDPYDDNDMLHRSLIGRANFHHEDVISRAQSAIDIAPKHVDNRAKERMHELVELDNIHAPLIARHMLMTGSPEYHEEFRDYIKSRGYRIGDAMRAAMSLTDGNGGRVAALAG